MILASDLYRSDKMMPYAAYSKRSRGRPRRSTLQMSKPYCTPFGANVLGINYNTFGNLEQKYRDRLYEKCLKPIEKVSLGELKQYSRDDLRAYGFVYGIPRMNKGQMLRVLAEAAAFFHQDDPEYDLDRFYKSFDDLSNIIPPPSASRHVVNDEENYSLDNLPLLPPLKPQLSNVQCVPSTLVTTDEKENYPLDNLPLLPPLKPCLNNTKCVASTLSDMTNSYSSAAPSEAKRGKRVSVKATSDEEQPKWKSYLNLENCTLPLKKRPISDTSPTIDCNREDGSAYKKIKREPMICSSHLDAEESHGMTTRRVHKREDCFDDAVTNTCSLLSGVTLENGKGVVPRPKSGTIKCTYYSDDEGDRPVVVMDVVDDPVAASSVDHPLGSNAFTSTQTRDLSGRKYANKDGRLIGPQQRGINMPGIERTALTDKAKWYAEPGSDCSKPNGMVHRNQNVRVKREPREERSHPADGTEKTEDEAEKSVESLLKSTLLPLSDNVSHLTHLLTNLSTSWGLGQKQSLQ